MDFDVSAVVKALSGFGSQTMEDVGVAGFVFTMSVSLVCSIFIAHLYKYFYFNDSTGTQIHRAFPLLGISVTAIFIVIQFSLPLSLGLLGALSIVRFRTPIKEPEEIGFLMLVIATSITCATFNFVFLGILLALAIAALLILRSGILRKGHDNSVLVVTVPKDQFDKVLGGLENELSRFTVGGSIGNVTKSEQDYVISYSFKGLRDKLTVADFQRRLSDFFGDLNYNIFMNQQRVL